MIPAHVLNKAIEAYNANVGYNIAFPLALEAALEVAAWHIWEKASDDVWDAAMLGARIPPNPYSREGATGPNYMRLWHASLDREAKTEQELIRVAELAVQAKDRAERAEAELEPLQASHRRLYEKERATGIRLAATITERNTEQHRAEVAEVKARGWRKRAEQWAEELDQAEDALSHARKHLTTMEES